MKELMRFLSRLKVLIFCKHPYRPEEIDRFTYKTVTVKILQKGHGIQALFFDPFSGRDVMIKGASREAKNVQEAIASLKQVCTRSIDCSIEISRL